MKLTKDQSQFTDKEKQEIVETINQESKSKDKPIYKVCEEYGLKLHNFYNWHKAIMKRQYKVRAKARKAKKAPLELVGMPKTVRIPKVTEIIKKMPVRQAVPQETPTKAVKPLSRGRYAVIVSDGEHLGDLLKELNF